MINRRVATISAVVCISLVLAGCVSSSVKPLPAAPAVKTPPTTSNLLDTSGMSIVPVKGATTTTAVQIRPGGATIKGRVVAGGSGVAGAVVHIERFVDDKFASVDVTTNNEGAYSADGLLGGRYRVRAFKPPDAAMEQAQVFFVGATETKNADLALQRYAGDLDVRASVSPNPPLLGSGGTISVTLTSRGVDGSGVARSLGSGGQTLTLIAAGGRTITSANPVSTDSAGRAQWSFTCNSQDNQGLTVVLPNGATANISVAGCTFPTTTTTAVPDPAAVAPAAQPPA